MDMGALTMTGLRIVCQMCRPSPMQGIHNAVAHAMVYTANQVKPSAFILNM
jgi:hypothetical protein